MTGIKKHFYKLEQVGQFLNIITEGRATDERIASRSDWLGWVMFIGVVVSLFLLKITVPPYSPDSWAYYELSQTIFSDFYRFSHFRSFWNESMYSASFPPLLPSAIAFFDGVLHLGVRTQYFLSYLSLVIFGILSEVITRRLLGVKFLGLSLVLLLACSVLADELAAGRTIPLQMVLVNGVLLGLLKYREIDLLRSVAVGFVSGLAVMNRFDAVLLPLLVAVLLLWLTRNLRVFLGVLFGAFVAVSPWILYSWTHFRSFFVSDNSNVAKAVSNKAFVTDWWPAPQATLSDDLMAWIVKLMHNFFDLIGYLLKYLVASDVLKVALVAFVSFALVVIIMSIGRGDIFKRLMSSSKENVVVVCFPLVMFLMLLPQIMTGYFSARYFTPFYWSIFLLIVVILMSSLYSMQQRQFFANVLFTIVLIVSVLYSAQSYASVKDSEQLFSISAWKEFNDPEIFSEIAKCIPQEGGQRVLVLGDDNFAARLGAQMGVQALMEPRNMKKGLLDRQSSQDFVREWDVDYVYVAKDSQLRFARKTFHIESIEGCNVELYSIGI